MQSLFSLTILRASGISSIHSSQGGTILYELIITSKVAGERRQSFSIYGENTVVIGLQMYTQYVKYISKCIVHSIHVKVYNKTVGVFY